MALVPYRVSGPAADQRAAERLLQLPGGITLRLTQWPAASGAGPSAAAPVPALAIPQQMRQPGQPEPQQQQRQRQGPQLSSLANVGLVVWQAGFLLADYLLRCEAPKRPHCRLHGSGGNTSGDGAGGGSGGWRSVAVVDLGTGCGVVGIALALAGAHVVLTDLPHVVPLAEANVEANCDPRVTRAVVCAYRWGDDPAAAAEGGGGGGAATTAPAAPSPLAGFEPDVITAADVLYHEELLRPLMAALTRLSAPHTVSYVSYRVRHGGEVGTFLALAEAAGFAAEEVPDSALHEEYRRRGGGGGGGSIGDGLVTDAMSDDEQEEEAPGLGQSGLAVERAGGDRRWTPGSYGILRLCRRDCGAASQLPMVTTGVAAATAGAGPSGVGLG